MMKPKKQKTNRGVERLANDEKLRIEDKRY